MDVRIQDAKVSRRHTILHVHGESIELEDLGSLNGSFVNDNRVHGSQVLLPGDLLRFGDTDVLLVQGALSAMEHEISTPVQSGYGKRLPLLNLPSVITEDSDTSELTRPSPELGLTVILALRSGPLVMSIAQKGAEQTGARFEFVDPTAVYGVLAGASPGALILDLDELGPAASDLVRAWRGPEHRRDPVLLLGSLDPEEGELFSARAGADGYLRHGVSADEVVDALKEAMEVARGRLGGLDS